MTEDPTILTPRQRIALLEATLSELADSSDGRIVVGGEEAELLWHAVGRHLG